MQVFATGGADGNAMLLVLDAVLPEHERLIRERVAREIEAMETDWRSGTQIDRDAALKAARGAPICQCGHQPSVHTGIARLCILPGCACAGYEEKADG
jgi:hypothetical protein